MRVQRRKAAIKDKAAQNAISIIEITTKLMQNNSIFTIRHIIKLRI